MFIFFIFTQYFLLSLAIDSKKSKSTSAEVFSWAMFFLVVHVFIGVIIYSDGMPDNSFRVGKFALNVVLPVFLGSILKGIMDAIRAKKRTPSGNILATIQANNNTTGVYQLEQAVQRLKKSFEQIKQQDARMDISSRKQSSIIAQAISTKLTDLQHRIDKEVKNNTNALQKLKASGSPKNVRLLTANLHKLQNLKEEKTLFFGEFQAKTSQKGQTKTSQKGQTKTSQKGQTKTSQKGQTKTSQKGQTKTSQKGQTKTSQKGQTKTPKNSMPKHFQLNDFLLKEIKKSEDETHRLEVQLYNLREDEKRINHTVLVGERKKMINGVKNKLAKLPNQIQAHINIQDQLIAKVKQKHPLGNKAPEVKQLRQNLDRLNKLHENCRQFSAVFLANQHASQVGSQPQKLISDIPITLRLSKIEKQIKEVKRTFGEFKKIDTYSEAELQAVKQFLDATPTRVKQLNQAIKDCFHDVNITCHPFTAKVRERQLNKLSEQLKLFTLDFEDFAKNLNITTILELNKISLPHPKTPTMPELELQAQTLWQDYHPESEEVFWELYNELLGVAKLCV